MDADNISPKETETEKMRLIALFTKELPTHGLLDLTGWIDENTIIHKNHTHSGFVRSVAYKIEKMELGEVIPTEDGKRFLVKELSWSKKHPYWHAFRLNTLNSIFALVVGIILGLFINRPKEARPTIEYQEITVLQNLRDSIAILQREINSALKTDRRLDSSRLPAVR
jgi:hypothetical protein